MNNRDRWIRSHLSRLHWGQFLQRAGEWLSGFLIVFALVVLLVKRLWPEMWPNVLWLGAVSIPVTWIAWRLSMRHRFTRDESVAMLDRSLGAGGLLMALSEVPDIEWNLRLPQLETDWRNSLPKFRPSRFASCVIFPLVFAIGVCFIPLRDVTADNLPPLTSAGERATERLQELLSALQEVQALEEAEQEELEEAIKKLTAETKASPLSHEKWETVDAMERKLRDRLERADLAMKQAADAAEMLADEAAGKTSLTDPQKEELEDEIVETLKKKKEQQQSSTDSSTQSNNEKLDDLLQRLTKDGTQPPSLPKDPAERAKMLDDLKEFLDSEQQRLQALREKLGETLGETLDGESNRQKLSELGEAQPGKCSACGGQCDGSKEGEECGICTECQGKGIKPGSKPGQGGVTRGPGDAPLTWGDESNEQGVKFTDAVLPKGFQEDPKEETIGVKMVAPEVDPAAAAARSAARQAEGSSGRETEHRTLRPRHQDVVRKFFTEK